MILNLSQLQRVLGIEDWDISVKIVPRHTLNFTGMTTIESYIRRARIEICTSQERDKDDVTFQQTFLHELGHVVIADVEDFDLPMLLKERLVWNLARSWERLGVEINEEEFLNGDIQGRE